MTQLLKGVGILFDLDGTLVDTAGDLAASMNHVLIAEKLEPIDERRVRHLVGHGAKAMIRQGFQLSADTPADEARMEHYVSLFLDHYMNNIAVKSRPFDHVLEGIEQLRQEGAQFAVCTNKREAPARRLISALSMDDLFGSIVGGDTTDKPKPDAAPLNKCIEELGVSRAIMIGDSDTDIAAAEAAGLACILHTAGYGPFVSQSRAAAIFDSYKTFPALVRQVVNG